MKLSSSIIAVHILLITCTLILPASLLGPELGVAANNSNEDVRRCELAQNHLSILNFETLLASANSCERIGDEESATYFLLLSQLRFQLDVELLFPVNDTAKAERSKRHSQLRLRAAGSGPDTIYRIDKLRIRLFERISKTNLLIRPGYNPGWDYKRLPDEDDTQETFDRHRHNKLQKLRYLSKLLSNDEYYFVKRKFVELNRSFNVKDWRDSQAVLSELNRLETRMNLPAPTLREPNKIRVDPDADFQQIYVGFNGPSNPETKVFTGPEEFKKATWIPKALSGDQISEILSKVAFKNQVLIAIALGSHSRGTGNVIVTDLTMNSRNRIVSYKAFIGRISNDCRYSSATSYPFVIATKFRSATSIYGSKLQSNFSDGCKPPVTGTPSN